MDDFIGLDEKQIARINRIREERAIKKIMGPEPPTTRFGEPISTGQFGLGKSAAESVFTNPDLLKTIGSFTNPKYPDFPDLYDEVEKYNDELQRYKDRLYEYENPPKQRQTARVKKEAEEEKNRLFILKGRLRILFDDSIKRPLYKYLEKLWALKYGGQPGTNADKSKLGWREIDKMLEKQMNDLLEEYDIESPP
jgi:hypothetical protein